MRSYRLAAAALLFACGPVLLPAQSFSLGGGGVYASLNGSDFDGFGSGLGVDAQFRYHARGGVSIGGGVQYTSTFRVERWNRTSVAAAGAVAVGVVVLALAPSLLGANGIDPSKEITWLVFPAGELGLAMDKAGNLYFSDRGLITVDGNNIVGADNERIREVVGVGVPR